MGEQGNGSRHVYHTGGLYGSTNFDPYDMSQRFGPISSTQVIGPFPSEAPDYLGQMAPIPSSGDDATEAHAFLDRLGAPGKAGTHRIRERLAALLVDRVLTDESVREAQFGG